MSASVNRETALERMEAGFGKWIAVDLTDVQFVDEADLSFLRDHITCRREALTALATEDDWRPLLEPTKAWINASLLTTESGQRVVSLLVGPPVKLGPGEAPSINTSVEPRPLRLC